MNPGVAASFHRAGAGLGEMRERLRECGAFASLWGHVDDDRLPSGTWVLWTSAHRGQPIPSPRHTSTPVLRDCASPDLNGFRLPHIYGAKWGECQPTFFKILGG
jgi:hypothetical protein